MLEDNFEVLGLGLEACVLDSITGDYDYDLQLSVAT